MYYPIEFRTMQDLLNVIETNWVVLISDDGNIMDTSGNLQAYADLSLQNAVRFDANDSSANEVIARWKSKDVMLAKQPIFVFADYYEIIEGGETVDDFAISLVDSGKVVISNAAAIKYYAPKTINVAVPTKDFAVNDVLTNVNGTTLTVTAISDGGTAISTLAITAGGKYLSARDTITVVSSTGTTDAGSKNIPVNVTAWEEVNV